MSGKIEVVLLQAVKSLGQKNQVVAVSIAYAKNVLFPKGLAKQVDAGVKNDIAQKKEQDKKHLAHIADIWDNIVLYVQAQEPMIIKRKVTPSGSLYEKVHETDVRKAFSQWNISLSQDITMKKQVRDSVGSYTIELQRGTKKILVPFTIKESLY